MEKYNKADILTYYKKLSEIVDMQDEMIKHQAQLIEISKKNGRCSIIVAIASLIVAISSCVISYFS